MNIELEGIEGKSKLTWGNILAVLDCTKPIGLTNAQIALALESEPQKTSFLTNLMFEAGVIDRVSVNATSRTHFYHAIPGRA